MKAQIEIWFVSLICVAAQCHGQGTLSFTFDGPPYQSPGTTSSVQEYSEAGMLFRPLGFSFGRAGGGIAQLPENGTAYLQAAFTQSLMFSPTNGSLFGVVSVDLAEYSTVAPIPLNVSFFGYRFDGSVVTTNFILDGIIDGTGPINDFQTFYFGAEFNNLSRVEVPDFGSLDNLTVSQIPEPGTVTLLLTGGAVFAAFRFRKRKNWELGIGR